MKVQFFVPGIARPSQTGTVMRVERFMQKDRLIPKRRRTEWGEMFRIYGMQHRPSELLSGPVIVECWIYLPRPKKPRPGAENYPIALKRNDLDNLVKGSFDEMNGVVWHDDSQITDQHLYKRYAEWDYAEEYRYPAGVLFTATRRENVGR